MCHAHAGAEFGRKRLEASGIDDDADLPLFSSRKKKQAQLKTLPIESMKLLLTDSISPLPLHKTLVLIEELRGNFNARCQPYELLALAKALVNSISNLHFGPEVA